MGSRTAPFDHRNEENQKIELSPNLLSLAACSVAERKKSVLALRSLQSKLQKQSDCEIFYSISCISLSFEFSLDPFFIDLYLFSANLH